MVDDGQRTPHGNVGKNTIISGKSAEKLRIMVVDDERDITTVLKKGLERHGFDVDTYNDPAQALADYRPNQYDLLLLDIRMPKMSGFELFRKLKDIDPNVKACFLTAFEIYFDEFRRMFPKLHVRCFAKKPIGASELRRLILQEIDPSSVNEQSETSI